MRRLIIGFLIVLLLAIPVNAMDFTAPEAPGTALPYMPDETDNFGEGLLFVLREAIQKIQPDFWED